MIKDLLKSMLELTNDTNLNPSEKILLSSLILYHSHSDGYSYPNYEHLMISLSTNRKATVSDNLKALVGKNYITIKKGKGNKNLYFIHKHLFYVGEEAKKEQTTTQQAKSKKMPVDSDGRKPLENQIHIDEVIQDQEDSKVIEISKYTGFNNDQSKELLKESGNNTAKVINAFQYMRSQSNIKNEFTYTKWAITNEKKINVEVRNPKSEFKTVPSFNNFEAREYDFEALEKRLLGWEDQDENQEPKSLSDYMIKN